MLVLVKMTACRDRISMKYIRSVIIKAKIKWFSDIHKNILHKVKQKFAPTDIV